MSQLLNSYPVFEGNQVLTSSQLNQLVAYLDEQNRQTRAKLIGTGIVCGLELAYDDTVSPITITISKGMGVTSQGYLITQADCVLDRYKPYELPATVSYPPFEDPQTGVQDVILYKLVTPDYVVLPGEDIHPLDDPADFLDDKVVLLFLECSDNDLKSCLGQSCDERGMDRVFVVRKLLIGKTDMDIVLSRTCSTQTGLYNEQYNLPEIIIRRALFDPESEESTNYYQFSKNYINAIRGDMFFNPPSGTGTGLFDQLFDALRQTYTDFAAILAPVYSGTNPFDGLPNLQWTNFLNGDSAGPNYLGTQYFYDFVKDLILAYDEFRDVAFELISECCTDLDCFPKHLMLGEAIPVTLSGPSQYRNGFVTSPAFNGHHKLLQKVIMLHKRMVIMTRQFDLAAINNPSVTPVPPSELGVSVLITPSREKRDPLSLRSIPYYYDINADEPGLGTLDENWNYEYTEKNLFAKGLKPLAYGNQDIVQTNDQGPVATPLYYNTDPYNFLRIEGAIRQNYVDVTAELEDLRDRFDLPFNIITLRLTGQPLDDIAERCNFDDIRTQYGALNTGLRCMISSLFDRYAIDNKGTIQLKGMPAFFNNLIEQATSSNYLASVTQAQIGVETLGTESASAVTGSSDASTSASDGTTAAAKISGLAEISEFPVYAPQRTMAEALADLDNNLNQLANKLYALNSQFLPFNITDFDFGYTGTAPNSEDGFIQTYLDAVQYAINAKVDFNQINDLITHSLKLKNTPDLYYDLSNYMREIMAQLDDFINDCRYKSLTLLYYTYQYRLQYIKDNDQNLFSNFIKKHPGVEHTAGVPRGGTYIMVVNGDPVTVDKPSRQFAVAQIRQLQELKVQKAKLQAKPLISIQDGLMLKRIDSQILQIDGIKQELAVAIPVEKYLIEGYQVIADFSLPYLCCCDCECEDIPHPTDITQLGIPALATPFYAEYSTGDYAFGKDVAVGVTTSPPFSKLINVVDALQYDTKRYSPDQIKLYLVNKNGTKMIPRQVVRSVSPTGEVSSYEDVVSMSTTNYPNDPGNTQIYGTVSVREYTTGEAPQFVYSPQLGISNVTDSWYYMFEILDAATGITVARSTMAKVTVSVM